MNDPTIIAAFIALGGSLIAVYFLYRQWKASHNLILKQPFINEKRELYKQLWELLPDISMNYKSSELAEENKKLIKKEYIRQEDLQKSVKLMRSLPDTLPDEQVIETSKNEILKFYLKNAIYLEEKKLPLFLDYFDDLANARKCSYDISEYYRRAMSPFYYIESLGSSFPEDYPYEKNPFIPTWLFRSPRFYWQRIVNKIYASIQMKSISFMIGNTNKFTLFLIPLYVPKVKHLKKGILSMAKVHTSRKKLNSWLESQVNGTRIY